MIKQLFIAFKQMVAKLDWMDEPTKKTASEKVKDKNYCHIFILYESFEISVRFHD